MGFFRDYERSDEEICGKKDRVWEKICQIQETENNYSGEYMHNYVWIKLFRAKIIDDDQVDDIRKAIREEFSYNINKLEFDALCKKIVEKSDCWVGLNGWRLDYMLDEEVVDCKDKTTTTTTATTTTTTTTNNNNNNNNNNK